MESLQSVSNDYLLWQAFKAGNEAAFEHLYQVHFTRLFGYGTSLCPDRGLVKDCIQNLFVDLWRSRTHLADVCSIRHYLYKSLRRNILRELNRERKYLEPEALAEEYFEVSFSREWLLIHEQITEENYEKLLKAFELLTKRQKEAVFLRFYENLEYEQIAEVMAMKEAKYARTLIYRALAVLKASIRNLACLP